MSSAPTPQTPLGQDKEIYADVMAGFSKCQAETMVSLNGHY